MQVPKERVLCLCNWTQIQPLAAQKSIHQGVSSVQSLSHVWFFANPWTVAHQASLSITNSWSPPKPMFIESVMPSNHLILCHPLLLLPSVLPSIRVFSNEPASGGQSIGVSDSALVLPMNIQNLFPLGWTGWISLQSKGFPGVCSNTTVWKDQFFGAQLSLRFKSLIHTWLVEKPQLWLDGPSLAK